MEQQAKERLTGGVILVVLLVALVPELLTGPRRAPPPTPVQPDQAPMRSYTIDLGDSARANSAPVTASTAVTGASEPATQAQVMSGPVAQPRADDAAVTAASSAPDATGESAPEPATREPATGAPPPAAAAGAHTTEHAAADHAGAAWAVQVATFSSRANAVHMVANLKSRGFVATLSEATKKGHKLFRVRVGSEKDRAAAQKLLGRLKSAGEKNAEVVSK